MITNQELKELRIGDWIGYNVGEDRQIIAQCKMMERGQYFFDIWENGSLTRNFSWMNIDKILDIINLIPEQEAKIKIIKSKLNSINKSN